MMRRGFSGGRLGWAIGMLFALLPWGGGAEPAEEGQWSEVLEWPVSATHAHLLPTGKVMFFGEFEEGVLPPRLWDPETGQLSDLPRADFNIFCAGHSFLADGRLLLTGGHVESHVGVKHVRIFDPFELTWEDAPDMNDNRWYPTNTTLPNGDVVILSGETHEAGMVNPLPQVWQAATNTLRDLVTAERKLPYYPRMFLAPNGKLFFAGPWQTNRWLDPEGTGTWFSAARSLHGGRDYGAAVMYDTKVLLVGGGKPPTEKAEEIDLAAPSPAWRNVAPMKYPRRQLNATLLPDGTTLVTGGSSGEDFDDASQAILHPELYDPATDTWTVLAPAAEYRGYHSTALLLPDGRVMTGGGRHRRTAQIFSPPYLFKGPRPIVSGAPETVRPRERFRVETPDAERVERVTLLALGSVTHAFDQHQRFLTLGFTRTEGALEVIAPESNVAAPPGYYMLFLVDSQGVPSVAHMVRLELEEPRFRKAIVFSDTWKYDDRGVDHGTAWLAADFDDSGWESGPGQLGYGDGDEGTVLDPGEPTRPTVYFRKTFTLETAVSAANLELLYDDGLAVWINGVPILTRDMGDGTDYATWATASVSNEYERVSIPLSPNPFRVGENVVTAMVKQVSETSNDLTFALSLEYEPSDAPPAQPSRVVAIPFGSEWKYEDSGEEPGPDWNTRDFDDSAWASGPGQLGYGEGDEATVLARTSPSQTSVYFRGKLTLDELPSEATLRVLFDDGLVVYVNGTQVLSRNMGSGTGHEKYASASEENARAEEAIPIAPFVQGENIIGVMVKQNGRTSPDLSFDLELELGTPGG